MTKRDTAQETSERAARVALEDQIRLDVERAIQAESSVADVARVLGKTREHMYRYIGKDAKNHLPAAHLLMMPRPVMLRVLNAHLQPQGLFVADLPPAKAATDDMAAILEIQRSTSATVTVALEAIADGHLTRSEGAQLVEKIDAAIAALLTARQLGEMAKREGVVAVRRVGPR